jgi:hypothetical protein
MGMTGTSAFFYGTLSSEGIASVQYKEGSKKSQPYALGEGNPLKETVRFVTIVH